MKGFKWIVFVLLFSSLSVFSQEKYARHTVTKGETVSEIAKKYKVTTSVIYELNPDAVNGLKHKEVLLIPTSKTKTTKINIPSSSKDLTLKNHEVLPKETVYGIAKQSNISVTELYTINPDLEKEGLKIGETIKVPQATTDNLVEIPANPKALAPSDGPIRKEFDNNIIKEKVVSITKQEDKQEVQNIEMTHEVLSKESWYSIARKYGITVAALQNANSSLEKLSLRAGQKINIPEKSIAISTQPKVIVEESKEVKLEKIATKTEQQTEVDLPPKPIEVIENVDPINTITRVVLPKESLYSIAKQYGITVAAIQKANPKLETKSLKVGQSISIPVKEKVNSSTVEGNVAEKKVEQEVKANSIVVEKTKELTENKAENIIAHEVLPKETKYGIAKKYGLSVAELEKQNPSVVKKLLVGSILNIFSSVVQEKTLEVEKAIALEGAFVKEKFENKEAVSAVHDEVFIDQLISRASENIGTHYRSGGISPKGFDCSGLICYTFSNTDIKLPRSSGEMAAYGSKIQTENAQKGDLIFFSTRGSKRINHVGMVVEVLEGEIKFIHSATHGGVMISSTKESYYERNLVQVNRVL